MKLLNGHGPPTSHPEDNGFVQAALVHVEAAIGHLLTVSAAASTIAGRL